MTIDNHQPNSIQRNDYHRGWMAGQTTRFNMTEQEMVSRWGVWYARGILDAKANRRMTHSKPNDQYHGDSA